MTEKDFTNEAFEAYYQAQGIVAAEEWPVLLACLRRRLPLSFRITPSTFAEELRSVCAGTEGLAPLPWYPGGLGWAADIGRSAVRSDPALKAFHAFLVTNTERGLLSRQEAVSMLPPLLLDVAPGHRVLDLCAAPGSKTAQLLEAVHSSGAPGGYVVANDTDMKRCQLLSHQIKRLGFPGYLVTCHAGQHLPWPGRPFDRILCDVPCSGDGTLRKAPDMWRTWTPAQGLGLHGLQLSIAARAAELLAPGGRMVYSTCSLNPMENEAVVAELLVRCPSLALLDVSTALPALRARPGLTTWKVIAKGGRHIPDLASVPADIEGKIRASHFPPADAAHLTRCLRIVPHDADTGGFFIAVFEKRADAVSIPAAVPEPPAPGLEEEIVVAPEPNDEGEQVEPKEDKEEPEEKEKVETAKPERREGKSKKRVLEQEPFADMSVLSTGERAELWAHYGLQGVGPELFVARSEAAVPKQFAYVPPAVAELLALHRRAPRLVIINTGLRAWVRKPGTEGIDWRPTQEALQYVAPALAGRTALLARADLRRLVDAYAVPREAFSAEGQAALAGHSGFTIFRNSSAGPGAGYCLAGWCGPTQANLLIEKAEKDLLLAMMDGVAGLRAVPSGRRDSAPKRLKTEPEQPAEKAEEKEEKKEEEQGQKAVEEARPAEADLPDAMQM